MIRKEKEIMNKIVKKNERYYANYMFSLVEVVLVSIVDNSHPSRTTEWDLSCRVKIKGTQHYLLRRVSELTPIPSKKKKGKVSYQYEHQNLIRRVADGT